MNPVNIGAGVALAGLVAAAFIVLEAHMPPDAQRLLVRNDFADADCDLQFDSGDREGFLLAKGGDYKKTYKAPRAGFVTLRCRTSAKTVETPGSFHLVNGALAQVVLSPDGIAEYRFFFGDAAQGK